MHRAISSELEKESAIGMGEGRAGLEGVWRGRNGDGCQPKQGLTLPHMYPSTVALVAPTKSSEEAPPKPVEGSLSSGPPRKKN